MPVVVRSARALRVLVRPEIFPGRPEILSWAEHSRNSLLPGRSVSYRYLQTPYVTGRADDARGETAPS